MELAWCLDACAFHQVKRKRGRPRTRPEKIKKVKKKKMKRTKIGRPSKKELEERKAQESQEAWLAIPSIYTDM